MAYYRLCYIKLLVSYPLGFDAAPSAPVAWGVETDPTASAGGQNSVCIWFYTTSYVGDDPKNKGLGSAMADHENKYRYKVLCKYSRS